MLKYNDSAKHIHRPVPCPAYDLPRTEAWLEAMAREGLLLARDGLFLGFADFEKSTPCTMKYRLQAAKYAKTAFDDGEPPEAETEFHEAMGWEYVARRGNFHIYRCFDPHAPELNTDPLVQAQTIKAVHKRMLSHIISLLIWLVIYPVFFYSGGIIRGAIATGSFFTLLSVFIVIWGIGEEIVAVCHIGRLKKTLQEGERPQRTEDWKKYSLRYISSRALSVALIALWIVLAIGIFARLSDSEKPLSEFEGEPPFATLQDIFPEGENYEPYSFMGITNNFEYASAPLISPETIIWREAAYFSLPEEGDVGGNLTVYYYEMSHPLLAQLLVWEIIRDAKEDKYFEELPAPDMEADYLAAYTDHFPNVLIRQENVVIEASFFPYKEAHIDMERWAVPIAESIS